MKQLILMATLCFAPLVLNANADDPQETGVAKSSIAPTKLAKQPMSTWMERKLGYSQAIFKALATGDLETVRLNAAQMNLVGKVEGFARMKNRPYQAQLHTFDRISHEIALQADKGNIEGATLAFNQLTVNCVQCHKLLRAETANK